MLTSGFHYINKADDWWWVNSLLTDQFDSQCVSEEYSLSKQTDLSIVGRWILCVIVNVHLFPEQLCNTWYNWDHFNARQIRNNLDASFCTEVYNGIAFLHCAGRGKLQVATLAMRWRCKVSNTGPQGRRCFMGLNRL